MQAHQSPSPLPLFALPVLVASNLRLPQDHLRTRIAVWSAVFLLLVSRPAPAGASNEGKTYEVAFSGKFG
jgi:hypothetical protein